jgi:prepilin-type processing-associated H-X9-DG protein
MENLHAQIIDYLLAQSWQIAVLAVAIAAVSLAVKNKSAHVRYLLWLIVLAKCLVPPLYTITLAVLPQQEVAEPVVTAPVEMPTVTIEVVDVVPRGPIDLPPVPVAAPPVEPTITERLAEVTVRQWLAFGWIVGASVFVLAAVIKALRVNRWLRRERRRLSDELQTGIESWIADLGVKTIPKVWLVEGIGQPFVWGLLRGSIYLPANFAGVDSGEHRRGILGHELSHILRFDAAVNLLQIVAQAVYWFHPFVWWANKKIRAEREKCCDEMAIARLNTLPKDYSTAIVNTLVAEHEAALPIPSLAVAGPVKNIEDRIKTIMNPGKKFYKRPSLIAATSVLVLALFAVSTTLAFTARVEKRSRVERGENETAQPTTKDKDVGSGELPAIAPEVLREIERLKSRRPAEQADAAKKLKAMGKKADQAIAFLISSFKQAEDVSSLKGHTYGRTHAMSKIRVLVWVGKIGGEEATRFLRQALTREGAEELARAWINGPLTGYFSGKEQALNLIQGRAAVGLVYSQDPENIALVEKKYRDCLANYRRKHSAYPPADMRLLFGLTDAVAGRELIEDFGWDTYYTMITTDNIPLVLSSYLNKYLKVTETLKKEEAKNTPIEDILLAILQKPRLKFRMVARKGETAPAEEFEAPHSSSIRGSKLGVLHDVLLDESDVKEAAVRGLDQRWRTLALVFTESGAEKLGRIASNNPGRRLAIFFNDTIVAVPQLTGQIDDREISVVLERTTPGHANLLARAINVAIKKAAQSSAGDSWGEAVEGLRCRWVGPVKAVAAGTAPVIALEVENVSDNQIIWQCRSEHTWRIYPRGSEGKGEGVYRGTYSPKFRVVPGEGVRLAGVDEARRNHEGAGSAVGYYRLGPRARMRLISEYLWVLTEAGQVKIDGYLNRRNPGGGGAYPAEMLLRNRIICPALVLEVTAGDPAAEHAYEVVWSEPVGGLQAGIKYEYGKRPIGYFRDVELSIVIRNITEEPIAVTFSPTGHYDDLPRVRDKRGRQQRVEMASDYEKYPPDTVTFSPGFTGTIDVVAFRVCPKDYSGEGSLTAVLYTDPGKYTLTRIFRYNLDGGRELNKELSIGPIELEVVGPGKQPSDVSWGEAVEGLQLGLAFDGEERLESAEKLKGLGKAATIYANDDEKGRLPDALQQLHEGDYVSEKDLTWLLENIEYLGKGKTAADAPDTVIAYDKTLLRKGKGTNVLFLDGHVAFERPEQLEKLGIAKPAKGETKIGRRWTDTNVYKQLGEIVELSGWRPEMSFGDAIKELKNSVEPPLKIVVLWGDLAENADIDQTTQINIGPLPPVRLSMALELLLKSVSTGAAELGYVVENGIIIIATVDSLPSKMETRVYDIALLVGPPLPGGYGGYGARFYGEYGVYKASAEDVAKKAERAKEIAKLIEELIEPDSWWGAGGEGVIKLYENRQLIVLQTRDVHQKIEKLLRNMQRPGLGAAGIPYPKEFPYPVPWWQGVRAGDPNSAVQIEGRFILLSSECEIGDLSAALEDSLAEPIMVEPNVTHHLLEDEQIARLLTLIKDEPNCGRTLAAPKVTVLSGESATLSIQTQTVVALPPQVTGEALPYMLRPGTDRTIPSGITLNVTPIITPDKENLLLNLNIQMNNFLGMKTYNFETPLPDGTVAKYEQELPQIETVSMQTRVSMPDGAVVLSGKKVKWRNEQDEQIVEKELLILIKADIVELDPNAVKPAYRFGGGYGGGSYGLGRYGGYGGGYGGSSYGGGYGGYSPSPYGGGRVGSYGGSIEAYRKYPAALPVKSKEPNSLEVNSPARR